MENLIFFSLIFALFINFGVGAINFSGVNRTFMSIYRGLIEASIAYIDEEGEPIDPYFKKDILETYLTNYFQENLTRYVTHYTASIYYFNYEDETVCTSKYCQAVKVSLDCQINFMFHYSKARIFYLANYEHETSNLY